MAAPVGVAPEPASETRISSREGACRLAGSAAVLLKPLHDELSVRRIAYDLVGACADGLLEPSGFPGLCTAFFDTMSPLVA